MQVPLKCCNHGFQSLALVQEEAREPSQSRLRLSTVRRRQVRRPVCRQAAGGKVRGGGAVWRWRALLSPGGGAVEFCFLTGF